MDAIACRFVAHAVRGILAAMSAADRARAAGGGMKNDMRLAPLAIGIVVALAIIGGVSALVWFARRRHRYARNWTRFADSVAERGLSRDQGELLIELAKAEALFEPAAVIEKIDVFERAVERHLRRFVALGPGARDLELACERVRALRGKLNFWAPRSSGYFGTRELDADQSVRFGQAGERAAANVWAKTGARREDFLQLVGMERVPDEMVGKAVDVIFFNRNHAYSFHTEVVAVDPDAKSCLLNHTVELRSAGKREFHRVDLNRPITFRAPWEKETVAREGKMLDLSAGGLAIDCACFYETGEKILFHFEPELYYTRPAADAPMPSRDIRATIIRTRRVQGDRCIYHAEFREITGEDRRYLSQLVHRIDVEIRGSAW